MNAYPLQFPVHIPRTKNRVRSDFGARSIGTARDELLRQLGLMRARNIIISSNLRLRGDGLPISAQANPDDPGIAVYFDLPGMPGRVIACDNFTLCVDNLWAIARGIDGLRAIKRYGVGQGNEQFTGFAALPAPAPADAWWAVLGVSATAHIDEVRAAFRTKAKTAHPDAGGNEAEFGRIQAAWERARKERNE